MGARQPSANDEAREIILNGLEKLIFCPKSDGHKPTGFNHFTQLVVRALIRLYFAVLLLLLHYKIRQTFVDYIQCGLHPGCVIKL